jgi:translocation and assembly module TamB
VRQRLDQLGARRVSAAASLQPLPPWLATRDLKLALDFDPSTQQPTAVELDANHAELLGARLQWQRIAWRTPAQPGAPPQIDVSAALEPMAVAPWLARLQPDFGWRGDLMIGARIDVHSAPSFNADIVVERTAGDLSVVDIALASAGGEIPTQKLGLSDLRLALAAHDGIWYFTQALAGTTVGVGAGAISMRVSPQTVWPPADTPLEGVLEAQVADLGVWGTWLPAGWRLGGTLRTSASIGGRFGGPEYTGRVSGRGLALRNLLEGVNVKDGEIDIALQGETARIERFYLKGGDGRVTLDGDARVGATPQAQLRLTAERFQVLGRVDRRIVASGNAALKLDAQAIALDGRLKIDEGLVDVTQSDAPSLGDDVEVLHDGKREAATAEAPAPTRDVRLDLRVDLGDALSVRGRGIDTRLAGELAVTAPRGRLAVNGNVRTVEGKYAAYGQKLEIDRGLIGFSGPVENPRLDILAIRPKLDVKVGVAVTGNAQAPRVRLTSEPEMSDTDKLSWLILGRAPDGLGRTDAALLQRAALGVLAGEEASKSDQLISAIGLDELSVSQTEGATRDTVVTLGKQLGSRWYVGYERGMSATAGNWQLIYRIAQRFTLRGQSGLDNAIDAIWTWRWD